VPRKKTKKSKKNESYIFKSYLFWFLFIFIWIVSLIRELDSTLGFFIYTLLNNLFWEYYRVIFSPIIILFWIWLLFREKIKLSFIRILGLFLYLVSLTTIFWFFINSYIWVFNIYNPLSSFLGNITTFVFCLFVFLLSIYLVFRIDYKKIIKKAFEYAPNLDDLKSSYISISSKNNAKNHDKLEKKRLDPEKKEKLLEQKLAQTSIDDMHRRINIEKKSTQETWLFWKVFNTKNEIIKQDVKKIQIEKKSKPVIKASTFDWWKLPSVDLLDNIDSDISINEYKVEKKSYEILEKLRQFKISVEMVWYRVGPTVIQYRLKPDEWVKLNKIENLKKDLTLALQAKSIRIQAPIPGEWVVWIEVPNEDRQPVWLREIIESEEFNSKKYNIPIAIWKDVNWNIIVWDLAKMPHLLIAGQTWSWKSVWMNGFLVSLLYRFSPNELKMIMIDPKMVELSVYNWIPHLLTPVITSPDKALNSLKWAVAEMLRRYDLAKNIWARNLWEYNAKVNKENKLPYIVIVIDELADLMMSWNKKEVEQSIARIAQMARAVWMHLIVATQRPSVDVITWLIKSNIPSRIAFTVASQIDSRTIIDKAWAEDLLGRWDMLYFPTWNMEPERVQWVLVQTHEVEAVVNELKLTIDPEVAMNMYDDSIVNWKSKLEWSILEWYSWDQDEDPEIIEKAIKIVKESRKWSTSLIQRKLWLWYARAAKVLDILEELWVVGPSNWSKPREVYID